VGYHFETKMENGFWVICDDNVAPKGYAYLLIMDGFGTVKSCMFSGFKQEKVYVQRTVQAYQRLVGLEMKNPRPHAGTGNFYIPKSAYSGIHLLVGEQAGFQDTMWGFGMRLAMSSGILAAQSLLTMENYDSLWQRELKPQLDTSVVNRAAYWVVVVIPGFSVDWLRAPIYAICYDTNTKVHGKSDYYNHGRIFVIAANAIIKPAII